MRRSLMGLSTWIQGNVQLPLATVDIYELRRAAAGCGYARRMGTGTRAYGVKATTVMPGRTKSPISGLDASDLRKLLVVSC
jgi:hypothetical protein